MIQFLTVANSILSIESAKVVVSIAHDAISTTFELTLQSGSNSIRLTMTANLPIEWVSVIVAIGSSMMVGGPTSPTPAYN